MFNFFGSLIIFNSNYGVGLDPYSEYKFNIKKKIKNKKSKILMNDVVSTLDDSSCDICLKFTRRIHRYKSIKI
jgi:hypothetical protein